MDTEISRARYSGQVSVAEYVPLELQLFKKLEPNIKSCPYICQKVRGAVASWLVRSTPERAVRV